MTMPDDLDLTPDLELAEPQPVEEVTESVTSDAPVEEQPTAPPAPDLSQQVAELVQLQKAQFEANLNQQRQAAAPPPPPAWVDPFERPENVARIAELEENATWDPAAARQLRAFERQLDSERQEHQWQQREAAIRQEMQGAQVYQQATSTLRTEAARYGDLVDTASLDEVTNEVFSGVPEHQRAMALQDPTMRRLLTEAAAGRRVLNGKQPVTPATTRPAAPPPVQSSARTSAAPKQADPKAQAVAMWTDRAYLEGTMNDLLFGSTKPRTADHEELLS